MIDRGQEQGREQERRERVAGALATIATEQRLLRTSFDEHRGEVGRRFDGVDARLRSLESVSAGRAGKEAGQREERGRLVTIGRGAGAIVMGLLSLDFVHRYAETVGRQVAPAWFK